MMPTGTVQITAQLKGHRHITVHSLPAEQTFCWSSRRSCQWGAVAERHGQFVYGTTCLCAVQGMCRHAGKSSQTLACLPVLSALKTGNTSVCLKGNTKHTPSPQRPAGRVGGAPLALQPVRAQPLLAASAPAAAVAASAAPGTAA
eukprot:166950-Pelagomonas_calceolata.AAC.2